MTPDAVTNAIVAAISAGTAAGATDVAKKTIADAYDGLKSLVKVKFGDHSEAAEAIEKLEAKPNSTGRKQILNEELETLDAGSDSEIFSAAEELLEIVRALPNGERHIQFARGVGIAQADRGGTASVTISGQVRTND
jgi:hypothetical protein